MQNLPQRISDYHIRDTISHDDFIMVLRAEHFRTLQPVVIKLLNIQRASEEVLKRFTLEAQVHETLNHPGIARLYEVGLMRTRQGDHPFLVVEWVDGLPLKEYVERAKPELRDRVNILLKICAGVNHAHMMGIIHRDLKPANIIVDGEGQPKIIDFGLAKVTHDLIAAISVKTRPGTILGTPNYMSPEQATAESMDERTDIYALGALGYLIFSGAPPLPVGGMTLAELCRVIVEDTPTPLGEVAPECAGQLERIIARALEKERSRRFQSVREMARELHAFLKTLPE